MRAILISLLGVFLTSTSVMAADCTAPAGVEGEMIYNSDHHVMQYCNGTDWLGLWGGGGSASGSNGAIQFAQDGKFSSSPKLMWNNAQDTMVINGVNALQVDSTSTSLRYKNDTGYAFMGPASGSSANGAYIMAIGKTHTTQAAGAGSVQMGVDGVSPAMVIKGTTGNVGIGTTSPAAKLDVANATIRALDAPTQYAPTSGEGLEMLSRTGIGHIVSYNRGNSSYRPLWVDGNILALNSGSQANVGVRLSAASYALHVNGTVAGSAAYVNTSDARLKKNVADIPYGLDSVLKLRPVAFEWIDQKEEWAQGRKVGLIAQETEAVVPEVVSTADDDVGTKSIAYGDIVPVLIKAVQEQQAQIDDLKAEIKALKNGAN